MYNVCKKHFITHSVAILHKQYNRPGFTLIELLVVVAIVGMLASAVLASLQGARQNAYESATIATIHELKKALLSYSIDTGERPPTCWVFCTAATDPLLNQPPGVSGWEGPYLIGGMHERSHGWGGDIGIYNTDFDGDGFDETYLTLDDDKSGTDFDDSSGPIPTESLINIDRALDDGNLSTGNFRGDGQGGPTTATGEGTLLLELF